MEIISRGVCERLHMCSFVAVRYFEPLHSKNTPISTSPSKGNLILGVNIHSSTFLAVNNDYGVSIH